MQKEPNKLENKTWMKKPLDNANVREAAARYNISLLKATILLRRGVDLPEDMLYFLENSPVFLYNPFLFTEMTSAVERIINAIEEKENIMIFGDRDADGICSTALMVRYFQHQGIPVSFDVPVKDDPYGLSEEKVAVFQEQGITLIICVDNGSSAHEAIHAAYQAGIDVIVLDHHAVQARPEHTFAFINPQWEEQYKHKDLSASAVVLKTLFALDFARTEHFSRGICLIHVTETEEELLVETTLIVNMLAGGTQTFHLQQNSPDCERFLQRVQGFPLYTLQADKQAALLSAFFSADVFIHDIASSLPPSLARFGETSLESLRQSSSLARFFQDMSCMDVLVYIYQLSIIYNQDLLPNFWTGLDLAAIGLVTDMMPMRGENRIITKMGVKALQNPNKTAMVTLLNHLNLLGEEMNTKTIGWRIGPLINASGRMGQANKAVELFITEEYSQQETLVEELGSMNKERKNLSEIWFTKSYNLAQKSYEKSGKRFIFVYHPDLPLGLTGLLAGRLSKIFPQSLVVVTAQRNPQQISGSLRTGMTNVLLEFLRINNELFENHGGHQFAGGFSAEIDSLTKIEPALSLFFSKHSGLVPNEEPIIYFDAELPGENFPMEVFDIVEQLAPYGEQFKPLVFFTKNISVSKIQLIGKGEQHLRMAVNIGPHVYQALWWNHAEVAETLQIGDKIDLLYHIESQKNFTEKVLHIIDMRVNSCPG